MLPDMAFRAVKTGPHAHDGVAIQFRAATTSSPWRDALRELSGGQRSLVALAFLTAAGAAGAAPRCSWSTSSTRRSTA